MSSIPIKYILQICKEQTLLEIECLRSDCVWKEIKLILFHFDPSVRLSARSSRCVILIKFTVMVKVKVKVK
jgi:hypothetical protein